MFLLPIREVRHTRKCGVCPHLGSYLKPLMEKGMIERTDPDSPKSPRQEYELA